MGTPKLIDGNLITDADPLQVTSSGGTGGGAVTIADGADVAQGTTSDAATASTVIGRLKKLVSLLPAALGQGTMAQSLTVAVASDQTAVPTSVADGSNVAIGAKADAAWVSGPGSVVALLKGVFGRIPVLGSAASAASLPVVIASDQSAVAVVGNSAVIQPTLTVTASAYSAGNGVGGSLTLTGALRVSGGTGILESITITDAANQKAALDILLFDSAPSGGTYTDKTAFAWGTNDITHCIGRISVAASDYATVASKAVASLKGIGLEVAGNASANLFALIVTSGTPTYAATSDLTIRFGFLRD